MEVQFEYREKNKIKIGAAALVCQTTIVSE